MLKQDPTSVRCVEQFNVRKELVLEVKQQYSVQVVLDPVEFIQLAQV